MEVDYREAVPPWEGSELFVLELIASLAMGLPYDQQTYKMSDFSA